MTLEQLKKENAKLAKALYPCGIIYEPGTAGLELPSFIHTLLRNEQPNPNNDDKPTAEGWAISKYNPKNK